MSLETVRRLDIEAAHHRAVDVPGLRDTLLACWRGGHLAQLLGTHDGRMHLPVHHSDRATGKHYFWTLDEWREWLIEQLAAAELFYVTPDMTEVVTQAAAAAPAYQVFADRMPARSGFVVYARPYCRVPSEVLAPGQRVELTAALWGTVPDVGGGADGEPNPGVMLLTLQDSDVLLWTQPVHTMGSKASPTLMRRTLAGMRLAYGPLSYHEEYPLPYGDRPWDTDLGTGVKNQAVAAALTTWLLMSQRITTVEREVMPKHIRKAAQRAGRPEPVVRTVGLRQRARGNVLPVDPQQAEPGAPSRKYTKRWPVRDYGYWRNTWYPSKERHEQQFVWVPGYMKGAEGAPIIGGERVNVLRH